MLKICDWHFVRVVVACHLPTLLVATNHKFVILLESRWIHVLHSPDVWSHGGFKPSQNYIIISSDNPDHGSPGGHDGNSSSQSPLLFSGLSSMHKCENTTPCSLFVIIPELSLLSSSHFPSIILCRITLERLSRCIACQN